MEIFVAEDLTAESLAAHWPDGCDLLVVDDYTLHAEDETPYRSWARRLFIIDDLADRRHDCDLLLDPKNQTFVSLGLGCIISLALACWLTRDTPVQAMRESRRLTESLGWALVLPQMLAMLGLVFADAGVGKAVAHLTTAYINMDYRLVAVVVYCVGMALFTVIMGNGFAAFPVMTGGVGVPILVGVFHANPAVMAAIGMFSGYCGTLMTPMAANFNIVPAALLELSDKNAVIKAQVPTALLLLAANIVLLYFLMLH